MTGARIYRLALALAVIPGATAWVSLWSSNAPAQIVGPQISAQLPVRGDGQTNRQPDKLPFVFIGQWVAGDQRTAFLVTDGRLDVVRVGDVIDGRYRIERIDDEGVDFMHLLLNVRQRVFLGAAGIGVADDVPQAPRADPSQGADAAAELESVRERLAASDPREPSLCAAAQASNLRACQSIALDEDGAAACRHAAEQTHRGCVRSALRAATPEEEP